ncbi:hypothetical protein [Spongiimicrobium sp. 3-5]|uniref:hypothetical protein n=1 Tax=Spongiimicrobium sp. 3-5 TaxID=3332596 RepID=UPI0039805873
MNSNKEVAVNLLKYTFGLVPIVAGLDKFLNLLTDWSQYLAPSLGDMLPMEAGAFMVVVGIIEIVAGILVLVKTKIGALIVSAWLGLIALTLLFSGTYIDVAVRDLVMAIAAFSLSKLVSEDPIKSKN